MYDQQSSRMGHGQSHARPTFHDRFVYDPGKYWLDRQCVGHGWLAMESFRIEVQK